MRRAGTRLPRPSESHVWSAREICAPLWRCVRADHQRRAGVSRRCKVACVPLGPRVLPSAEGHQAQPRERVGEKADHAAIARAQWFGNCAPGHFVTIISSAGLPAGRSGMQVADMFFFPFFGFGFVMYFLPTIVALARNKRDTM